jgi:uncharacterized membrane protein (DUF4010 family)
MKQAKNNSTMLHSIPILCNHKMYALIFLPFRFFLFFLLDSTTSIAFYIVGTIFLSLKTGFDEHATKPHFPG